MALEKIGRYEIVEQLGRGGMATVYRAYDPSFKREVAIKVLPREFLEDPTFRERFEREAQAIAGLEHSAIVPVYDYGEDKGQRYLVMRYMPGKSLADRIKEGPLSPQEVTPILERVGAALDSAHKQGVIHRDLKPANILFDQHGDAYLADFGIVKIAEATVDLTGTGLVGTPAYMAPEMGEPGGVTPLIDIYALGITLFEMLAGRLPYNVDTPIGMIMAHIGQPIPSLSEIRPDLPPGIQPVLERAVAKDSASRYQTAAEFAADFGAAAGDKLTTPLELRPVTPPAPPPEQAPPPPPPPPPTPAVLPTEPEPRPVGAPPSRAAPARRRGKVLPWLVGGTSLVIGLIVLAAAVLGLVFLVLGGGKGLIAPTAEVVLPPTVEEKPYTTPTEMESAAQPTSTEPPPTAEPTKAPPTEPPPTDAPTPTEPPTIPPKGEPGRIAYTQSEGDAAEIAVIDEDGQNYRALTSNDDYDGEPDWSPDGSLIAFESIRDGNRDIYVMSASGGGVRRLTTAGVDDRHPDWSPGGTLIVYESGNGDGAEIYAMNADGSGYLRLTNNSYSDRAPKFSPDGTMIAYMTEQGDKWEIAVIGYPEGDRVALYDCPAADCRFPAWSPDGTQIAYNTMTSTGDVGEIWLLDVLSGESERTVAGGGNGRPAWSGDGTALFFNHTEDDNTDIYRLDLLSGVIEKLTSRRTSDYGPDWGLIP
jgi:tRNA A-37 threonylcarbamoyl transferase component Bud32